MPYTKISKIYILILFSLFAYYSISLAEPAFPFKGSAISDGINVRSDSTISASIICTLKKNQCVEVLSCLYDWYKIRLPKTTPSFIRKDLVTKLAELPPNPSDNIEPITKSNLGAKVTKDRVNIRLEPNESSHIVGKSTKNEVVTILDDVGGWYRIEPVNSSYGWVHKKFIKEGCAEEIKKEELKQEKTAITAAAEETKEGVFEGVVKPYGRFFSRPATHKLITTGKTIYLLKADPKNLNLLNNHKVRITGIIIDSEKQKYQTIQVQKTEVLD